MSQISTPSEGSKPGARASSGAKSHSQTTSRPVHRARDEPRDHDEVGLRRQEEGREDRVVVDALPLLVGEVGEGGAAEAAAHREAAALLVDEHVAAQDSALPEIVGAAAVVRELGERRVDGGTVVALREVLEDELPVGANVVDDAPRGDERAQAPRREAAEQGPEDVLERTRTLGEAEEDEALPLGDRRRNERVVGLVEPGDVVHVGGPEQRAVEPVGPGVIRALDPAGEMAAPVLAEPRAAVAADVEEGAELPVLAADEDEALAGRVEERVVSRGRQGVRAARAEPPLRKDRPGLAREDLRRDVVLARKRRHRLGQYVALVVHRLHRIGPRG